MKKIKNYNLFILEDKKNKAEEIVKLAGDDSYALDLISSYCKNVDTTVDLTSSISLLSEETQDKILSLIKKHKFKKQQDDANVLANTDLNLLKESEVTLAGKNLFNCFCKIFTALGYKNIQPNWKLTPTDFLVYYSTNEIDYLEIRSVTSRFKYLDQALENLKTSTQNAQLYFGLRNDLVMEYGILFQDNLNKIGEFKFTKSIYNTILISDYLALLSFKSILSTLEYDKVKLMCRIKREMMTFNPGYFEDKLKPYITDNVITFGFFGIGRWDNGVMDEYEVESVKNNLKSFLLHFKWSQDVKISVVPKNFWIYINIKLK